MREIIAVSRRDLIPKPRTQSVNLVDSLRNNFHLMDQKAQSVARVNHMATRGMFIEDHDHRSISEMNLRDGFSGLTEVEFNRTSDILAKVGFRWSSMGTIADLRIATASA